MIFAYGRASCLHTTPICSRKQSSTRRFTWVYMSSSPWKFIVVLRQCDLWRFQVQRSWKVNAPVRGYVFRNYTVASLNGSGSSFVTCTLFSVLSLKRTFWVTAPFEVRSWVETPLLSVGSLSLIEWVASVGSGRWAGRAGKFTLHTINELKSTSEVHTSGSILAEDGSKQPPSSCSLLVRFESVVLWQFLSLKST